jgi:hypothetical protein
LDFVQPTGIYLVASPAAGTFGITCTAGSTLVLIGEQQSGAGSKSDVVLLEYVLPQTYTAGTNVTVTLNAQLIGGGAASVKTLTVQAYLFANAGTTGANLCATGAQSVTASPADYTNTITGTTLNPGQKVMLVITSATTWTSGTTQMQLNSVRLS